MTGGETGEPSRVQVNLHPRLGLPSGGAGHLDLRVPEAKGVRGRVLKRGNKTDRGGLNLAHDDNGAAFNLHEAPVNLVTRAESQKLGYPRGDRGS